MKCIITRGISTSGKTTFAKTLADQGWMDINRDWIRFNIVAPGSDWSTYRFTNKREREVSEIQTQMIMDAYSKERDIIISDTNLDDGRLAKLVEFLEDLDIDVEVKLFPVTLEEAYRRDTLRANGVGHQVIYKQYLRWLDIVGRQRYTPDTTQPKAVIFDVDGTLAQLQNRGPFEWEKVGQDKCREVIADIARGFDAQGYTILVVSGRDGSCYDETKQWLIDMEIPFFYTFMREEGDNRKDSIVKEEIFFDLIAEHWNVVAVVDDRPQVVRLWHELGIENVLAVANPYIEF